MILTEKMQPYIKIARIDHWFKNVFMLPGAVIVLLADRSLSMMPLLVHIIIGVIVAGLVASSNYVLNEVLDAKTDQQHPVKCNRPVPSGLVDLPLAYAEWITLGVAGILIAAFINAHFMMAAMALWIMGVVYNVPPLRSKEKPFMDVLSESVNNPLRLLMGWYVTGTILIPPVSLLMAYWMIGAFFMTVKRFAEYRMISDASRAEKYRKSFAFYSQERLLVSIIYYAVAFGLFFGIFIIRYRIELILSIPFIAGLIAWYIHIGFMKDSPAQYPERLYKQRGFFMYTLLCTGVFLFLFVVDLPWVGAFFKKTIEI